MLHERRLKRISWIPREWSQHNHEQGVRRDTLIQTPTSITFAGKSEMWPPFPLAPTCVVSVCVGFGSVFVSRADSIRSLSLLHAFVRFHWWGSGAEGSVMRLFDRGMCSAKPHYMCALHVPRRALPYWYTFYAKYGACVAEEWRDWWMRHMDNRRGSPWLLHPQAALQTEGKHRDMPNTVQVSSLKPMCQGKL